MHHEIYESDRKPARGSAILQIKSFKPVPEIIQQLMSLKKGRRLVYYRGNMTEDTARCSPNDCDKRGAPRYQDLLRQIELTVIQLVKNGRITLEQRELKIKNHGAVSKICEYAAIGI